MSGSSSVPTISPAEMQLLVSRAGLALNPGQVADLVLAWRQVAALISRLPHDRPLQDDFAYAFRLPPPGEKLPPPRAKPALPPKPPAKAKLPAKPAAKRKAAPAKPARRSR
jgi:hypothetical protein